LSSTSKSSPAGSSDPFGEADLAEAVSPAVAAVVASAGPRVTTAGSTGSAASRTTSKSVTWAGL
jgi:hypothetical protein